MESIGCSDCRRLLAVYRKAVNAYTSAARELRGMLGDDYMRALEKVDVLRIECSDAHAEVLAHCRNDHSLAGE